MTVKHHAAADAAAWLGGRDMNSAAVVVAECHLDWRAFGQPFWKAIDRAGANLDALIRAFRFPFHDAHRDRRLIGNKGAERSSDRGRQRRIVRDQGNDAPPPVAEARQHAEGMGIDVDRAEIAEQPGDGMIEVDKQSRT